MPEHPRIQPRGEPAVEVVRDTPGRTRLRSRRKRFYRPEELAAEIFTHLDLMEQESNRRPQFDRFRSRTGLLCAAEFRGVKDRGRVEDPITEWLAERISNAEAQVSDFRKRSRPDLLVGYEHDVHGDDVAVVGEAKPVWQRWITTGECSYVGTVTDELGRTTGRYASKNIRQVVETRDKLLQRYTDPRDRHLLLAFVFQREREIDQRLVNAVGNDWDHRRDHVRDLCSPPDDSLGMTTFVFWPRRVAAHSATSIRSSSAM